MQGQQLLLMIAYRSYKRRAPEKYNEKAGEQQLAGCYKAINNEDCKRSRYPCAYPQKLNHDDFLKN